MRKLTFLVLILASLYGGYWFVGAGAIEKGARDGLADLRASGWDVRYDALNTAGFPSRFDTTVTDLSLVSADHQFMWRAPFVQVFALSYQPNRVIAALPTAFSLGLAGDPIEVVNERLRLSAAVNASTDLALSDITVEADALAVTSPALGQMTLNRGLAALRAAPEGDNRYDVYAEATGLVHDLRRLVSATSQEAFSDSVDRISFDGTVTLDRPLDRHAFDGTGPEPTLRGLELRDMRLDFDDISIGAAGQLDVDALGVPNGRITLRTAQWRAAIDLLVAAGLIEPGMQPTLTNMARAMAAGDETLVLPLSFQNGFMSIGPVPLGPAPRLR